MGWIFGLLLVSVILIFMQNRYLKEIRSTNEKILNSFVEIIDVLGHDSENGQNLQAIRSTNDEILRSLIEIRDAVGDDPANEQHWLPIRAGLKYVHVCCNKIIDKLESKL